MSLERGNVFYRTFDLVHFCACKTGMGLKKYRAKVEVLVFGKNKEAFASCWLKF